MRLDKENWFWEARSSKNLRSFFASKSQLSVYVLFLDFAHTFLKRIEQLFSLHKKVAGIAYNYFHFFRDKKHTKSWKINYFASVYIYGNTGCGLQAWGKQNSKYFCIHKKFFKGITYIFRNGMMGCLQHLGQLLRNKLF